MIKEYLNKSLYHWKVLLSDNTFKVSLYIGVILLTSAYVVDFVATVYNDSQSYISVGDLILDEIPTINMEISFTWGMYIILFLLFFYPIVFRPEIVPFALKTYALLMFIRAGFILLTNVGPPEGFFYDGAEVGGNVIADLFFRNDLFFSGHTAYPFIGFLIFRDSWMKWVFLAGSIFEGFTVLVMHIHYSIDVFAAFFIAYGTYRLSRAIFKPLTMRFASTIKLYGWDALQNLKKLKDI